MSLEKFSKADLKYVSLHPADFSLSQQISSNLIIHFKTNFATLQNTKYILQYASDIANILRILILVSGEHNSTQLVLLKILTYLSHLPFLPLLPIKNSCLKIDSYGRPLVFFDFINDFEMFNSPESSYDCQELLKKSSNSILLAQIKKSAFFLSENIRAALSYVFINYFKFSLIGCSLAIKLPATFVNLDFFFVILIKVIRRVQKYYFQPIQHLWLLVAANQSTALPTDAISKILLKNKKIKLTFSTVTSECLHSNANSLSSVAYIASVNLPRISNSQTVSFDLPLYSAIPRSINSSIYNTNQNSLLNFSQISNKHNSYTENIKSLLLKNNNFDLNTFNPRQSDLISKFSCSDPSVYNNQNTLNQKLYSDNNHYQQNAYNNQNTPNQKLYSDNNHYQQNTYNNPTFSIKPGQSSNIFSFKNKNANELCQHDFNHKSNYIKKRSKREFEFDILVKKTQSEQIPWLISMPSTYHTKAVGLINIRFITNFILKRIKSLGSVLNISLSYLRAVVSQVSSSFNDLYNATRYCTVITIELSDRLIHYVAKFPIMKLILLIKNRDSQTVSLFLSWICACFIMDVHFGNSFKLVTNGFFLNKRLN
ncbi:hypothetical protein BB561_005028 [Smittium simulii]|uniref:Uncharacterized protein n=1 Tax=Smittium simulii TaxID=133385 RepID=A0A2T9YCP3_9FUNG|nr:hypothetical protein BB561_005028 [Smittium simulii]